LKSSSAPVSLRMKLLKVLYNLLLIDAVPIKQLTSEKKDSSGDKVDSSIIVPNEEYVDISYDQNEESKEEPFLGYMDDES